MKANTNTVKLNLIGNFYYSFIQVRRQLFTALILTTPLIGVFSSTTLAQQCTYLVVNYGGSKIESVAQEKAIEAVDLEKSLRICPSGCIQSANCNPTTISQTITVEINNKVHYLKQAESTCQCSVEQCNPIIVTRSGWDKIDIIAQEKALADVSSAAEKAKCPNGCTKGNCGEATFETIFFENLKLVQATITCPCLHARVESEDGSMASGEESNVHPNPSDGHLNIEYSSSMNTIVQLAVYDFMGRVLQFEVYEVKNGSNSFEINASSLNSGMYLITIKNGNAIESMKFMIEK